jgi:hypothetical protein
VLERQAPGRGRTSGNEPRSLRPSIAVVIGPRIWPRRNKAAKRRRSKQIVAAINDIQPIIASEQSGRVCYAVELEPRYVDVAVVRWQAFTGQDARHAESGQTFSALASERAAVRT